MKKKIDYELDTYVYGNLMAGFALAIGFLLGMLVHWAIS